MVAMSGAIMPEPLAMPLMVTRRPAISQPAVASLGKVSVVMMARAASCQLSPAAVSTARASTALISAGSSGSPITPVDATKTSCGWHWTRALSAATVLATVFMPAAPVKALALPALTRKARAFPLARLALHQSTGAERVFEVVKQPAIVVPGSNSATSTSGRPL